MDMCTFKQAWKLSTLLYIMICQPVITGRHLKYSVWGKHNVKDKSKRVFKSFWLGLYFDLPLYCMILSELGTSDESSQV
jgi:hypothetical protein